MKNRTTKAESRSFVFFVNRTTIPWPPEPLRGLTIKAIGGDIHIEDRLDDARKKWLPKQLDRYS